MKKKLHALAAAMLATGLMLALAACSSGAPAGSTPAQEVDESNAATYTVTLDPNGGTWADGTNETVTVEVQEGKAVDFASYMPEYEGNTLYGWYQTDGSPWPGARKISGDTKLRAKWSVAEEEEVYALTLTIDGEPVTMEYEDGVYQFTFVSSIYGGYAQRAGKYTVYEEDLLAAMEADDGTAQRVIYLAESNYVDATGVIYGEFYNDGEFELYYDYTTGGKRTKYPMNVGFWTYEGYTAPFENTPIPEGDMMGYESAHAAWDDTMLGREPADEPAGEAAGGEETPAEGEETPAEGTEGAGSEVEPGENLYTANATVSTTMFAFFHDNNVVTTNYSLESFGMEGQFSIVDRGTWSLDGDVLTIEIGGNATELTDMGDGTFQFTVGDNTYSVVMADFLAAVQ